MGINLFLGSFAIITAATFPQCANAREGTLAGENTPVWTAHCPYEECHDPHLVTYRRLTKGAVTRAIDYMKTDGFQGLRLETTARSIKQHIGNVEHDANEYPARPDRLNATSGNTSRSKLYDPDTRVIKLLVVAQYDSREVTDDLSRERFIHKNILYTVAYWRGFNQKVSQRTKKTTNWPRIQVELVGIIVALNRTAAPYLNTSYTPQRMLALSNAHWRQLHDSAEFPRDAYHAVATMTDMRPRGIFLDLFESVSEEIDGGSGTIIAWDSRYFRAVRHRTSLARFTQVVNALYSWSARNVKVASYMNPGKAVVVLPGQMYSPEEQCWLSGYTNLARLCPEHSKDCKVWCLNKGINRVCGSISTALEGTLCVNGTVG